QPSCSLSFLSCWLPHCSNTSSFLPLITTEDETLVKIDCIELHCCGAPNTCSPFHQLLYFYPCLPLEAMLKFFHNKPKLLSEHLTPFQDAHSDPANCSHVKA
ncbi:unnamed protein product, partial [Bubo scandiacus]